MPAAKKSAAKKAIAKKSGARGGTSRKPAKRAGTRRPAATASASTEAHAIMRGTRQSPYKMRLVIDQIRG